MRPAAHRPWAAAAAAALLAVCVPAAAGPPGPRVHDAGKGITITSDESWAQVPSLWRPLMLEVINTGEERTLAIHANATSALPYVSNQKTVSTTTVPLPPGEVEIELPVLVQQISPTIVSRFVVDGDRGDALEIRHETSFTDLHWPTIVTLGDLPTGLTDLLGWLNQTSVGTATVPLGSAPHHWQAYLGLPGLVALSTGDVELLSGDRRIALRRWVHLGGGTLWLHGTDHARAAARLGLDLGSRERAGDTWVYASGTGRAILTPGLNAFAKRNKSAIEDIVSEAAGSPSGGLAAPAAPSPITGPAATALLLVELERGRTRAGLYQPAIRMNTGASPATGLGYDAFDKRIEVALEGITEGLHDVPRLGYVLISLLLAVIIGPVNFLVLRHRRRPAFFYLTAPLLGLGGMTMLLGYTLLDEGVSLKRRHLAVLLHDPATGRGAAYEAHGTFGGILPPRNIEYPVETAVAPFYEMDPIPSHGAQRLVTVWSPAQRLARGWTRSRDTSAFLTVTPERVRMGMTVRTDPSTGEVTVDNGLTATAEWVYARLEDEEGGSSLMTTAEVAPGQNAVMETAGRQTSAARIFAVPFLDLDAMDWEVVARMEGLPHLRDDQLGGEVVSRRLWYVALSRARGEVPEDLGSGGDPDPSPGAAAGEEAP